MAFDSNWGPLINVLTLGVKGDGATDDGPRINTAITQFAGKGQGLFFPTTLADGRAPDSATMTWTIADITAGTSATGTIGANLPSNLLGLLWQAGMSFTGGGATNSFSLIRYVTDAQ